MTRVAPPLRRRLPVLAAVLAVGLLSTACGSTVQLSSQRAVGPGGLGAGELGAGGSTGGGPVTDAGAGGVPGSGPAVVAGGTGGGTSGTGGAAGAPGTTGGPAGSGGPAAPGRGAASIPPKGFGYDEKNVYFGIVTQNDAQQAFASFGADNVDPGDTMGQAMAMADHINSNGGILGRKLVIRARDVATVATATNPIQIGNEVCTYFTQDQPVVAVMSIVTLMDYPEFRRCLASKRVPLFSATVKVADDTSARELAPYFTQTAAVSWTRLAPVLVSRLKAQGWFGGWNVRTGTAGTAPTKVGIVVDSTAAGVRTGKLLKEEVARAGYPGALVFQYANASDGQSASVNNFNQNGVTHVIVTDVELLAFQSAAQSQQYRPRYGVNSYNAPYTQLETSPLAPPGAQNGSMGVGWAPALDVAEGRDPGASPGRAACLKIMAAGQQALSGKRLAQMVAFSFCDVMQLLQQGAAAGGLSGTALRSGMDAVAPRFPTAVGFGTALGSSKHFVPGRVRDLAWDQACSCFRYGPGTADL